MRPPSRLYALPPREPPADAAPAPDDEPSKLWQLAHRYRAALATAALLSAAAAWVAGKALNTPQWAIEGTLLYTRMPLPERHRGVLELPSLATYASWVKERAHLEAVCREFGVTAMTPDEFGERCLTVEQPRDTQAITVRLTYPWKEPGVAIVNRLMQLHIDHVAAKRRDAILLQSLQTARQNLEQVSAEARRLAAYVEKVQAMTARGLSPDTDVDPAVLVSRSQLLQRIAQDQMTLDEQRARYASVVRRLKVNEPLARQRAIAWTEVEALQLEAKILADRIDSLEKMIRAYTEELKNLPVQVALTKKAEQDSKAEQFRQEVAQLEAARATPGALSPLIASQGIDAREFSVKDPARCADVPVSSDRKALTLGAFAALMGLALAAAFVYDRARHPAPVVGRGRPEGAVRAGRAGRPQAVTVARVDSNHMMVRNDHWIRPGDGGAASRPPVTIGPDGRVEDPPLVEHDATQLALRIRHWLGNGDRQ